MPDPTPEPTPMVSSSGFKLDGSPRSMTMIAYGLYLGGFIIPFLPIAAIVLAYIKKGEAAGTLWATHFENLIFTFWVSLGVVLVSIVLMIVGIGFLTMLLGAAWGIYRAVLGIIRALEDKPFAPLLPFEPGYVKSVQ